MRDSHVGIVNVYDSVGYTRTELDVYRGVFVRIREALVDAFGLSTLYFTGDFAWILWLA